MIEVREYIDSKGNSPYAKWFIRLNATAAVKVATATYRMEQGNYSNVKGVGAGVHEYRIYFGKDGDRLVILLAGGTKNAKMRTSRPQKSTGKTINVGNGKR